MMKSIEGATAVCGTQDSGEAAPPRLVRRTIRITKRVDDEVQALVESGEFTDEAEAYRRLIWQGLRGRKAAV